MDSPWNCSLWWGFLEAPPGLRPPEGDGRTGGKTLECSIPNFQRHPWRKNPMGRANGSWGKSGIKADLAPKDLWELEDGKRTKRSQTGMNSMEFWALPAWSRILFQCTTEFKEYQEYPHGFSMDSQPLGTPGSSTSLRPPEGDGRTRGGTRGTTLECPARASGAGKKSAALQPHYRQQFPKNPTERNSSLCKAPTPSWSSTQGGSPGFPTGKRWKICNNLFTGCSGQGAPLSTMCTG